MSIKSELESLKNEDIYSLLLFTLYKCKGTNEFSALSEMAYLLDEKNLLNLCEYFGGMTITIPTIEELELLLCGLTMYKSVNIDGVSVEDYFDTDTKNAFSQDTIKNVYLKISEVMSEYSFGGNND